MEGGVPKDAGRRTCRTGVSPSTSARISHTNQNAAISNVFQKQSEYLYGHDKNDDVLLLQV